MDEAAAERALDRLIGWGLVEEGADGEIRGTRRWAAKLNAARERVGQSAGESGAPGPTQLVLAVRQALAIDGHTEEDVELPDCIRVLVTLELCRVSPEERAGLGFAEAFP